MPEAGLIEKDLEFLGILAGWIALFKLSAQDNIE